jgi:hypothetical protein
MIAPTKSRLSPASEMAYLIYLQAVLFLLWGLHVIDREWFVGLFFVLFIPLAVTKAFLDYRRKGL